MKTLFIFIISIILLTLPLFSQDVNFDIIHVCPSFNNGSITATVVSGTYPGPYSFIWTDVNGDFIAASDEDPNNFSTISDLAPGMYCIMIVSNTTGCVASNCDLEVLDIDPEITNITPTCLCPSGYGALNVEVTGGSGTYGYAWSGHGTIPNPTIPNPIVNSTGTYTVTVTDSQTGCEATAQATVTQCDVNLANNIQITPDCNEAGTSTLSIQLPAGYGLAPFEFKWIKVGFGLVETDPSTDGFASLENAGPGEYCLSLLTMNGCSEQVCDINVTPQPQPQIEYTVTPVTNGTDGAIALYVTGQPGPFSYLWSMGQTTANLSGLAPGTYCVTVTGDGSGAQIQNLISGKTW